MPIINVLPAGYEPDDALRDAWVAFGQTLSTIGAGLSALDDGLEIQVRSADNALIGTLCAADIKRKFSAITWSLATGGVHNGGVGEIQSHFATPANLDSWQAATAAVQVEGFVGYSAWHALGHHYLALHETAHVTALGLAVWTGCWQAFEGSGGQPSAYPGSDGWIYTEQVANCIAKAIGDQLGFLELPDPTEGFPQFCRQLPPTQVA